MDHKIKILHLEDSINDSELIHSIIENGRIENDYYLVDNENDYIQFLKTKKIDIILSDYSMPGYKGSEALNIARQNYSHIPFIFVSGTIGEDRAIDAMVNGATDYVLKDKLERLVPAIKRALRENELETKRKNDELELKEKNALIEAQNREKVKQADELIAANKELVFQNEEKGKRAAELIIANRELAFQNEEKGKRAAELIIANNELVLQNDEKEKRAAELVIANKELAFQNDEKEKRAAELVIANKELAFQNDEKEKRAAELVIANKELAFQNEEKEKQAQELIIAKMNAEESNRLKSAFLANMSHEIRTPMNGILGFSDLLKTPNLSGDQQQKYIKVIEKSGKRMLNIINDIVDISKIEAGLMKMDIKESNVNEQIEYIYTFFKPEVEAKGMQLFIKNLLQVKGAVIKTDREKLFAILANLVKNAIKYTNEGSIEFGCVLKLATESVDHNQNYELEFSVKDTGIGIPKDRQEAIFERFIQADIMDTMARQGAGLGLSISKAFVEMLGGKIWVESEEGIGSIFYFTLPYNVALKEKNSTKDNKVTDNTENRIKNLKILIAEDDEASEMILSINLSEFSNEIIIARNGLEAIEACRNNSDIDLILMDINMPDLNGYEATRQIRQFNKDVVIIAQTAFALSGDKEKCLDAGCNNYITKPINKHKLDSLIQKHFNK